MLKFTRKNKKLVIPVGINPSYNIDSSTLYNVSDADVVANDVIAGKIAYGAYGKIVGTLNIESEKEESYNEGIEDQKAKLETITITENGTYNREDGYNEVIVEVPDLNGDYNEGYSDGVVVGREEIITEQSDATITPQTVFKGEIGYGANNEKIVGEYEFLDFKLLGYSDEEIKNTNILLSNAINHSKQLFDVWNPNNTTAYKLYASNYDLVFAPKIDTSNVKNMSYMFNYCYALITVPLFDTSRVTDMNSMFQYCSKLTSIPQFNTSNVTNMYSMFNGCRSLTSIPLFDTSGVTSMGSMFYNCSNLTSIPQFNTSKVSNMYSMFYNCSKLENVAGFTNCGKGFTGNNTNNHNLNFSSSSILTKQSCLNIFNTIYDMTNTSVTDAKITLHATTKALLSADDIAIATSKGWTIA